MSSIIRLDRMSCSFISDRLKHIKTRPHSQNQEVDNRNTVIVPSVVPLLTVLWQYYMVVTDIVFHVYFHTVRR